MKQTEARRLTINQIAAASLRTGKKAYISLALGIFLSIFLVTFMCFAAQGVLIANSGHDEEVIGYVDFLLYDTPEITDQYMTEGGMFDRLGHVYVNAYATGTSRYIGWYDEDAEYLFNRRFIEGRMPEQAGEIALEESALELLGNGAGVGSTITLSVTPVDGVAEERTFTIVGIMTDQTARFEPTSYSSATMTRVRSFPAILIHECEAAFATGRTIVQRIASISETSSLHEVMTSWDSANIRNAHGMYFGVYDANTIQDWALPAWYMNDEQVIGLFVVILLALALLTASGVGIAQAIEGRLSHRKEEIGMLRAVGATRKQIKKIFGRESWIIALLLSPLSIAAGCGAVYLMSLLVPEMIVFSADWYLLLPIFLFSVMCILISANLPLNRASKIMPMSVIRDVELMRKTKSIRSQEKFVPAKLISSRQLKLHPARQIGAAVLIMLMLVCVVFAAGYMLPELATRMPAERAAFEIRNPWLPNSADFAETMPKTRMTQQDAAQIAALSGVGTVEVKTSQNINLVMDLSGYEQYEDMPEYLRYAAEYLYANKYIQIEKSNPNYNEDPRFYDHYTDDIRALRSALGIEESILGFNMVVLSNAQVQEMASYVVEGRVNMDAINAGTQVLVYAPTLYVYRVEYPDGGYSTGTQADKEPEEWNFLYENDWFHAGDTLNLLQLYSFQDEPVNQTGSFEEHLYEIYKSSHQASAQPVIGALIRGLNVGDMVGDSPCIVTTEQGAQAMGFYVNAPSVEIFLDGDVDAETEAYLAERIETISMRGEGTSFYNQIEAFREYQGQQRMIILTLASVAFIFLAVAVSIISGNVRRRIHSDTRMIGTLRAVGADKNVLVKCYNGQVLISFIIGFIVALVLYIAFVVWMETSAWWLNLVDDMPLTILAMAVFCAIGYFCCHLSLKMSIQSVVNKSIIENIKEL